MVVCLCLLGFVSTPTQTRDSIRTPEEEAFLKPTPSPTDSSQAPQHHFNAYSKSSVTTLLTYLQNPLIILLTPTFLVSVFRYTSLAILIQYASVRFGLEISTGALFYTETAVANIILFLFVLPRVIEWLKIKRNWKEEEVDLWMVRGSLTFLCVGALGIGIAPSSFILPIGWCPPFGSRKLDSANILTSPLGVLVFAAGFGSSVSALSLISHWVKDADKPAVYAAVVVLQSLGHAVGDPCLWSAYSFGLGKGDGWQALPFYTVSVSLSSIS